MRCRFCAEEIQDEAKICRFCGAKRDGDQWLEPAPLNPRDRSGGGGSGWLRFSAVLLGLAGLAQFMQVSDPVALFGEMRSGSVAIGYHLLFGVAFSVVGVGLYRSTHWAYRATVAVTILYTLDKVLLLLDQGARNAMFSTDPQKLKLIEQTVGMDMVDSLTTVSVGVALIGFWSLLLLVHRCRDQFAPRPA